MRLAAGLGPDSLHGGAIAVAALLAVIEVGGPWDRKRRHNSGGSMQGRWGRSLPPKEGHKIFLNVSENKSSDIKLIFRFRYLRKRLILTLHRMH